MTGRLGMVDSLAVWPGLGLGGSMYDLRTLPARYQVFRALVLSGLRYNVAGGVGHDRAALGVPAHPAVPEIRLHPATPG